MFHKKHIIFFGAIILFVVVLTSGVYIQEYLKRNGQEVILDTIPVDPRDILRGDYVELAYEIGRGEKAMEFAKTLTESWPIYALLSLGEDNRVLEYAFTTIEPKDGVYIRGEVVVQDIQNYVGEKNGEAVFEIEKQRNIYYPHIEQYFVPEGKGWEIERIWRFNSEKKLEVKITTKGSRAQILELLIDGKPIDFDMIESENPWVDEKVISDPIVVSGE